MELCCVWMLFRDELCPVQDGFSVIVNLFLKGGLSSIEPSIFGLILP